MLSELSFQICHGLMFSFHATAMFKREMQGERWNVSHELLRLFVKHEAKAVLRRRAHVVFNTQPHLVFVRHKQLAKSLRTNSD